MTKEEFAALPPGLALQAVYDALPSLRTATAPRVPYPPKFDGRMSRKGQYCWMSEMTLEDLRYWHERNLASAAEGGQYAEKNHKTAKALGYWVEWRSAFPTEQWRGERNHRTVTANAPSRDPELYDWEERGVEQPAKRAGFDDDAGGGFGPDDDSIPF